MDATLSLNKAEIRSPFGRKIRSKMTAKMAYKWRVEKPRAASSTGIGRQTKILQKPTLLYGPRLRISSSHTHAVLHPGFRFSLWIFE